MLSSWTVGTIRVTSLIEYHGPTHDPQVLYPDFDRADFEAVRGQLPHDHHFPTTDRLVVAIRIWLVEDGDRRILIDAGCGNGKTRRTPRMHRLNTLWPEWLAAAGQSFDSITDVVMTHLHADHVGWNTRAEGDRWVPTFPNARYHLPKDDYDWFRAAHAEGRISDGGSFADSIEPVVAAGMAEFITDQSEVAGCLRVVAAPGHTPGMLTYRIESEGQRGAFCADIFHHVVQILRPDWNTTFCILPEEARRSRAAFLAEAAASEALVMPCHFAAPGAGFIRRDGDGYRFEPAAPNT